MNNRLLDLQMVLDQFETRNTGSFNHKTKTQSNNKHSGSFNDRIDRINNNLNQDTTNKTRKDGNKQIRLNNNRTTIEFDKIDKRDELRRQL